MYTNESTTKCIFSRVQPTYTNESTNMCIFNKPGGEFSKRQKSDTCQMKSDSCHNNSDKRQKNTWQTTAKNDKTGHIKTTKEKNWYENH